MLEDRSFPGTAIKSGSADRAAILAIQRRLNERGCGPVDEDAAFGPQTVEAVRLFQARFPDRDGLPLKVDGQVGPVTWATLFGDAAPAAAVAPAALDTLIAAVLDVA